VITTHHLTRPEGESDSRSAVPLATTSANGTSQESRAIGLLGKTEHTTAPDPSTNMSSQKRKRHDSHEERTFPIVEPSKWQIFSASRETSNTYWTHKLYRGPHGDTVRLTYCRTLQECDTAMNRLSNSQVLGFDLEWKSMGGGRIKDQVSVIQLASDAEIAIIHIARFPGEGIENLLSPTLKSILEDPNTIKVGHCITADGTRLRKHLHIHPQGFTEVAELRPETDPPMRKPSLEKLIKTFFGFLFDKSLATSGWHYDRPLSSSQIKYAGADAYAGLKLFQQFTARGSPTSLRIIDYEARERKKKRPNQPSLLEKLKQLRSQLSIDQHMNVLSVANNKILGRIVAELPTTIAKLRQVEGMEPSSVEKYGEAILDIVRMHIEEFTPGNRLETQSSSGSSQPSLTSSQVSLISSQSSIILSQASPTSHTSTLSSQTSNASSHISISSQTLNP
jgi:ribonuclease D